VKESFQRWFLKEMDGSDGMLTRQQTSKFGDSIEGICLQVSIGKTVFDTKFQIFCVIID
jgi:hypothetical protein